MTACFRLVKVVLTPWSCSCPIWSVLARELASLVADRLVVGELVASEEPCALADCALGSIVGRAESRGRALRESVVDLLDEYVNMLEM